MPVRINEDDIEKFSDDAKRQIRETTVDSDRKEDTVSDSSKKEFSKESKRYDWMSDEDEKSNDYDSKRYDWAKDTDFNRERESIISQDIKRIKGVADGVKGIANKANKKYGPAVQDFKKNVARDIKVRPRLDRSKAPMTQRRERSVGKLQGRKSYSAGVNPIGFGAPVDMPGQYLEPYRKPTTGFNFDFVLGNPQQPHKQNKPQQYHGPTVKPPTAGFDFNPNFIFSHMPQPKMMHGMDNNHKKSKGHNGKKHR